MTRHTATTKRLRLRIVIEVDGERDESDSYRHRWVSRGRVGLLQASGPNSAEVVRHLQGMLMQLAHSPGALAAFHAEADARLAIYRREVATLGQPAAYERMQVRAFGGDPDGAAP